MSGNFHEGNRKEVTGHTFKALSWVFGFLSPMRFLRERMASFGGTVFERITSEISRLRAMSSLFVSHHSVLEEAGLCFLRSCWGRSRVYVDAYRLLLVARAICSSRADPAEEENHPIMMGRCV